MLETKFIATKDPNITRTDKIREIRKPSCNVAMILIGRTKQAFTCFV